MPRRNKNREEIVRLEMVAKRLEESVATAIEEIDAVLALLRGRDPLANIKPPTPDEL